MIVGNYIPHMVIGLIILVVIAAIRNPKGPLPWAAYFIGNALWATQTYFYHFGKAKYHAGSSSAMAAIVLIAVPLLVYSAPSFFLTISSLLILAVNPIIMLNHPMGSGLFGAHSMDESVNILALILFIAGTKRQWFLKVVVCALHAYVIYRFKPSSPVYILVAAGLAYGFLSGHWKKIVPVLIGGFGLAWMQIGSRQLFSDTGRFGPWKQFMEWWWQYADHWTGTGIGSFEVLGGMIQILGGRKDQLFIWAHNDWIQILFESGIIGLAIALTGYLYLLFLARRTPAKFCSLIGLGVCMMAQFPLHYLGSQVWAMALIAHVHRYPETEIRSIGLPNFRDYFVEVFQRYKRHRGSLGRLRAFHGAFRDASVSTLD